jgi:S-formylglutathione hydrolase FrmB
MLPPDYDAATAGHSPRRYPVLYFLHGLGDNEQTLFKGGGWDLIQDLRQKGQISDFLIVAPEGRRSFYINSADGRVRYSDFFIREFIPYLESHYSIRRERSARAISGFSMGGYGALRFAFAHPELFSSVSAQSAALIAEPPQPETEHRYKRQVCPSISTAAVRMTSDLIKEPRNSIGNFRLRASNTNITSIQATTAVSISWHISAKC